MKLIAIRLSGFKSFADNTVFPVNAPVTGIIGPNGCGKSNIIDAVKWVLGESTAKQLRGQSLTDIIFAGSKSRKPSGLAKVELHFENDGPLTGSAFAQYKEIVIQRTVTSDGQSIYRINQQRCRRKDLVELLQGTGVGARSYAVIEQGMVSKIVDSKPEDLRVFVEEAAGIAVYKSRRKETERKLSLVKENLIRHDDLLNQLKQQRHQLGQQAEIAKQYKEYQSELSELNQQLLIAQWYKVDREFNELSKAYQVIEKRYQECLDNIALKEKLLDQAKQADHLLQAQSQRSQLEKQQFAEQIAQLNQQQIHARQQIELYAESLKNIEHRQEKLMTQAATDSQQIQSWAKRRQQLQDTIEPLANALDDLTSNYMQREREKLKAELAYKQNRQSIEQYTQKIHYAEKNLKERSYYIEKLNSKLQSLQQSKTDLSDVAITDAKLKSQLIAQQYQQTQQICLEWQSKMDALKEVLAGKRREMQAHNKQLADGQSQLKLLEQWQAEPQQDKQTTTNQAAALFENIRIEKRWQTAIERYLGDFLNIRCQEPVLDQAWIAKSRYDGAWRDIINTEYDIAAFFNHLLPLELEDEAIDFSTLKPATYYLSLSGSIVGRYIYYPLSQGTQEGLFARIAKKKELIAGCKALHQVIEAQQEMIEKDQQMLEEYEKSWHEAQRQDKKAKQTLVDLKHKIELLERDYRHQKALSEAQDQQVLSLNNDLQIELAKQQELQNEYDAYLSAIESEDQRNRLKANFNAMSDHCHEIFLDKQKIDRQIQALKQEINMLVAKGESLDAQQDRVKLDLADIEKEKSILQERLDNTERQFALCMADFEEKNKTQKVLEPKWSCDFENAKNSSAQIQSRESEYKDLQYDRQLIKEQLSYQQEKLEKQQSLLLEKKALLASENIPANAELAVTFDEKASQSRSKILKKAIVELGDVNMAAIEGFTALEAEYQTLATQCDDLHQSLALLEKAIHELDQETKYRLKETFTSVSASFSQICPTLFRGGEASIHWTNDNILEAGIVLQVRPPGKKVKNLSALSGGEKALTAVALVFSFFKLNPAPFCLLDEIDAPLDDANVKRLCDLLQEMSKQTQFIMITHHKSSMQACDHLIGVTMSEPGVSRLVSVKLTD